MKILTLSKLPTGKEWKVQNNNSGFREANGIGQEDIAKICSKVYARDGYRCVLCSAPNIEIHHLKPRSKFPPRAIAAWRVTNLVCLCTVCHTTWHNSLRFRKTKIRSIRRAMIANKDRRIMYSYEIYRGL